MSLEVRIFEVPVDVDHPTGQVFNIGVAGTGTCAAFNVREQDAYVLAAGHDLLRALELAEKYLGKLVAEELWLDIAIPPAHALKTVRAAIDKARNNQEQV